VPPPTTSTSVRFRTGVSRCGSRMDCFDTTPSRYRNRATGTGSARAARTC
jgi:hypothetical protein